LGNFFCLSNNRLALIDFGMVGRISDERREQLADLLYAIVSKDIFSIAEVFIDWAGEAPVDYEGLLQEIDTFLDHYHGVPLKHIDFISLLTDLLALMRNHQLKLPPDLAMLLKAFFTLDGVGRKLNPDFDIVEHMTPFLDQVMANRYSPSAIAMRSWRHSKDLVRVLSGLPRDLRRLVGAARRGGLLFNVDLTRLDHFGHQLDKAANRMTIGLVVAAIIVGSSIVMTVEGGSRVMGIPIIGFIGFLSASIGGIWLLISIWRSGRDKP